MHIQDMFENEAKGGGKNAGLFAIAYALLEISHAQQNTAQMTEKISGSVEDIVKKLGSIADSVGCVIDISSTLENKL